MQPGALSGVRLFFYPPFRISNLVFRISYLALWYNLLFIYGDKSDPAGNGLPARKNR